MIGGSMINKSINVTRAHRLQEIAKKYNLEDVYQNIEKFLADNEAYRAHIVVVGGFSAGKSALLNKYIGKPLLAESQAPETALAAEITFSESERIVAIKEDGHEQVVSSTQDSAAQGADYLVCYVDSENVKLHPDYVLVDTPGFDSGIERHNKALMQYIDKGAAYIFVVDSDKGTISEDSLRFLQEVAHYSADIAIVLNKSDKKIPSELEKIKAHVQSLLVAHLGVELPIITTSIRDTDVVEKLNELIRGFDAQELYDKNMTATLNYWRDRLAESLITIKDSETCDLTAIDQEIEARKEAQRALQRDMQSKHKIKGNIRYNMKEEIVREIKHTLEDQIGYLVSGAMTSVDLLQQRVLEMIRPILVTKIEGYSDVAMNQFVHDIDTTLFQNISGDIKLEEVLKNVYTKVQNLMEQRGFKIPGEVLGKIGKSSTILGINRTVYRTVTSAAAIATNVLGPVLELFFVFLPDIIDGIRALFGESKEEKIKKAILNEVIPQIVNRLPMELDAPLAEIEAAMVTSVLANIQELLATEEKALEVAKQKRANQEEEYRGLLESIQSDIDVVKGV